MKLILALVFQLFLFAGMSGQKNILIEKFTNIYCGSCPGGHLLIQDLQEEYPELIWVNHHKPITFDVNPMVNESSVTLWEDFEIPGVPSALVDRASVAGRVHAFTNDWTDRIVQQATAPYYAKIAIDKVSYDSQNRTYDFVVNVQFDELPAAKDYRLTILVVEDEVWGVQQKSYFNNTPGHPLEGKGDIIWDYKHRNVVREILDSPWGSDAIIPDQPKLTEVYSAPYSFVVPADRRAPKYKVVALVSSYGKDNIQDAQVLNAQELTFADLGLGVSSTVETDSEHQETFSFSLTEQSAIVHFSGQPSKLWLLSMEGRAIESIPNPTTELHIDLLSYPSGPYILAIEQEGQIFAKQFSWIR